MTRADGFYAKTMDRLVVPYMLVHDNFCIAPLTDTERPDLFEFVEHRQARRSLIIASQLEMEHSHELVGDPTLANSIQDLLTHTSQRLDLKGASMCPSKK
ncbi:MAG: hypothetical protein CVU65_00280 [Deltaproteobacteria bacterium HGW-Deltaproteobacteria-22]|nr:MAG: hypothetical protein CVU65_00280 [Deltaproteobacteria bacterium HGW-Deltaproteobacteria-22]